jgi:ABC-2 type transport system permease protein
VNGGTADAELRVVSGPSALGGGWRRFFELLYLISVTEFRKTYFGTVLGYVWSLARPLIMYAVLLFVFTQIFRIGSGVPNYPVMLLFNIVLFSFFQEATTQSVTSVVGQEPIVRKTQFPRLVIPMATVLTAAFNLGMNMIAVVIFMLAFGVDPLTTWLFFPVILLALFALTAALSMLLSSLYVRFRDVAIIWGVSAMTLFYASPILYPFEPEIVPEKFYDILLVNPLTILFVQARHWIIDSSAPNAVNLAGGWLELLPAAAVFGLTCFLGVWIFNREAPRVAEEL